jgi:hypothetical protein
MQARINMPHTGLFMHLIFSNNIEIQSASLNKSIVYLLHFQSIRQYQLVTLGNGAKQYFFPGRAFRQYNFAAGRKPLDLTPMLDQQGHRFRI